MHCEKSAGLVVTHLTGWSWY